MRRRLLLALFFTLVPGAAFAADDRAPDAGPSATATATSHPAPANALSVALVGLLNSALVVQYERWLPRARVSVAPSIGVRTSGGEDFDVFDGTFGVEGRVWLLGDGPFSRFDGRAMVGPYVGVRADLALTQVSRRGHVIGSSMAFAPAVMLGARVAVARVVALTPHVGLGLRTEWDPTGRLAPWTAPDLLRFGLDLGVLF